MEELEEDCERRKAQAEEDASEIDRCAALPPPPRAPNRSTRENAAGARRQTAAARDKDEMLGFVEQEVEELKAMFAEKEQALLERCDKESGARQEAVDALAAADAAQAQRAEAAEQHEATVARLVRARRHPAACAFCPLNTADACGCARTGGAAAAQGEGVRRGDGQGGVGGGRNARAVARDVLAEGEGGQALARIRGHAGRAGVAALLGGGRLDRQQPGAAAVGPGGNVPGT